MMVIRINILKISLATFYFRLFIISLKLFPSYMFLCIILRAYILNFKFMYIGFILYEKVSDIKKESDNLLMLLEK